MKRRSSGDAILRLRGIMFRREERVILKDIDWFVGRGQVAAILGPNGCGKSTLLRIASGYLWPQRGAVELFGHRLGEFPVAELRRRIGIVEPAAVYPFDQNMTALDVATSGYFSTLTIGYAHPTRSQIAHARLTLAQVGLRRQAGQLYSTLSTGERLRCLIARALVRKPELLLLDEPTTGLDLPARESILATLARLRREKDAPAMVTITHHLEELLPATENVLLLAGDGTVVASGPPAKVITARKMSKAYGLPIQVQRRGGRYHAHVHPKAWEWLL